MSLQKDLLPVLAKQLSLAALIALTLFAHSVRAADAITEAPKEALAEVVKDAPKETMFQLSKSYFARVSDRLADSVTGKSDELINRAMEVIGVRYRWDAELPQSGLDGSSFVGYVF